MQAFARLHAPLPRRVSFRTHRAFVCAAQPLDFVTPPRQLDETRTYVVLSDLHVKRESIPTCLQALRFAHAEAVKRDAGILFLGDFWHARGALPVEPLNLVLKELETWSVPVVMIPGNHDLVSRSGNGVSLVPLATTLGADRCLLLTRPSVCLDALFLPYMHDVSSLKGALHHARHCLDDISAVFCHVEVAGARLADKIIVASSRAVSPSDFPPKVPVYSGHLHRPHTVSENIRYVGSPYQVSASERGQAKSLVVLDRKAGWTVAETIPISIGPRHITIDAQSGDPLPDIRTGDRVTVQTATQDDHKMKDLVRDLRARGIRVEIQVVSDGGISFPADVLDEADPFAPAEPRISMGALSNVDLFQQYATIKNLEPKVTKTGREILYETAGKSSSLQSNFSGRDVIIEWESVTLHRFGSFLGKVTYPLRNRGLVLITGQQSGEDGTATGRSNSCGKTTLAMSSLWALTGKTDARPDGSVEKGVTLEMVHDDAKDCEVTVRMRLRGDRVCSEVRTMMTSDEREQACLKDAVDVDCQECLQMNVTRTSSRVGTIENTRSYRQGLVLRINGVDLSCLDVKETQARIDRLVNGTLLPHTVFFGQHMGAGRGLIDSTDRTLKDHLAMVFPLDVWTEARKKARDKANRLQELLMVSEATLEADKSVVARLVASQATARSHCADFERERAKKLTEIEQQMDGLLSSHCRSDEDSIVYADAFPFDSSGFAKMIDDCKRTLRSLEEKTTPSPDSSGAAAATALERAVGDLKSAEDLLSRVEYLSKKEAEWAHGLQKRRVSINAYLESARRELDQLESSSALDEKWRKASEEMRRCDARLQELVNINIRQGMPSNTSGFSEHLKKIHGARQRASALREETVRIQTSLHEVRGRLMQSQKISLVAHEPVTRGEMATESVENVASGAGAVACESCLRPFDGELYAKARSRLEEEAARMEATIKVSEKQREDEHVRYEQAVKALNELIDVERNKILEHKSIVSETFGKVRNQREIRNAVTREIQELTMKGAAISREPNLYLNELLELVSVAHLPAKNVFQEVSNMLETVRSAVDSKRLNLSAAKREYDEVIARVERKELERMTLLFKKHRLQAHVDDLQLLQSQCVSLEQEKLSLQSEANPFDESLRMVTAEVDTEVAKVKKREKEFSNLKDTLNVLKYLDVAFGPRGVPSFVLEEGLVWLEKLTGMYLHKLSAGELVLQIRAFSDYKSSNRSDGDNKEVISKRVFVRKKGPNSRIRERSLRQLSGGQRRRCSLAFALAFADLVYERAGFQSSLMVMDEILQSLDEDGRHRMSRVLPNLIADEQGGRDTILVVTQDEAPEIAGLAHGGIDVVLRDADQSSVFIDSKIPLNEHTS